MRWLKELWPEWHIEEEIGAGAYGTVYKIKRQDIGGTYYAALKIISFPQSKNEIENLRNADMSDRQISNYLEDIIVRISREYKVMEQLKGHSNIVSYEDHKIVAYKDGLRWDVLIRMELLTPLESFLKTHPINEEDVCRLGIDICKALSVLEKRNIIHRDIKPGNIFISDYEDYKLGDFGLAKYASLYTGKRAGPRGTLNYMAPEVYIGKEYDHTIDIYSLGLILYRLLNRGRGPFLPLPPEPLRGEIVERANEMRFNNSIISKPVDASPKMAEIVLKACAFKPENRYTNAAAMKEALEKCQKPQAVVKKATRKLSRFVKKTVTNFSRVDDKGEKKELDNTGKAVREKTMNDFFKTAGDL